MTVRLPRRILVYLSILGLIASMAMWVGIKVGRPIYYSDGNAGTPATDLRNSGMLRWSAPAAELRIPGPVRGRVTELPDGRWIYGLVRSATVTDLVLFDPRHPGDPVQPVLSLNSKGHDLSPVLAAGGQLFFASDRPGGPGGFDIYTATYRNGLFYGARPLPEGINTGLDESDPAVDRDGGQIVFVRRDPELENGRNGKLMTASFATPEEVQPVFAEKEKKQSNYRRAEPPPIDRDPILAPDGLALYFVRQLAGRGLALMRTSWHVDHYVTPIPVASLQAGGPFRGPAVIDEGFGMRLVSGDDPATVVRSEARQVYPFWEGQWWLEWLLLYLALFFGSLLVLLTLGARWNQLDLITKLVLLSVLIHLLLLLWLSGVEIIRSFEPKGPEPGAVQVQLISQRASSGDADAASPTQNQLDVSSALVFAGHEQALQPAAPEAAVAEGERELAPAEDAARPVFQPLHRDEVATVSDPAAQVALRAAVATEAQPRRQQAQTRPQTENRTRADRRELSAEAIRVVVPDSAMAANDGEARSRPAAAVPAPARDLPQARTRSETTSVADTPSQPSLRANRAEVAGAAERLKANAGRQVAVTTAAPTPARSEAAERAVSRPAPAQNLLAGTAPAHRAPPAAAVSAAPAPRQIAAPVEQVADAPRINPRAARAAPAEARLARSERAAGSGLGQTERSVAVARETRSAGRSLVAAPRTDLPAESRHRAPAVPDPVRALPRRSAAPSRIDVALADTPPDAAAVPTREAKAAPESALAAAEQKPFSPPSQPGSVQVARGEPQGAEAKPLQQADPGSLLDRPTRPPSAARSADDPRPLRRSAAMDAALGPVALRDPAQVAAPQVAAAKASPEAAVAARELRQLQGETAAEPRPVRGEPRGGVTQPLERPEPGSMLARQSRRTAAAGARPVPTARPRDTSAALKESIELRDEALVADPDRDRIRRATDEVAVERVDLARLRQRRDDEPRRPRRDDYRGGARDTSIGLELPGSFLGRAGVRPGVPRVVARAENLTPYSNRFGANKLAALKKYGGSVETERAVANGLAYLARIQNRDGTWGSPRRSHEKYGEVFVGKSALCLLAFLGAGHTPKSDTEYSDVSRRAVQALLRAQRQSAHFGATSSYSHGITTYALAECFALTKDETLREPVERAVKWILANQNRDRDQRNRGGWGYFSSTMRPEDGYSRSSTSAWQVMALESAKLSGIDVPDDAMDLARSYLLQNYDRRYRYFLYNREPDRLRSEWRTLPASTPAAVFCLQLLGMEETDPRLAAGLEYSLDRLPTRYRRYSDDEFVQRGAGNVYFWYYSTLACFMAGGESWNRWNAALKRVLLDGQDSDGSFPLIDAYARYAGDTNRDRSYTTAMCVLSLEVYYRYFTPLLKKDN